MKRSEHASPPIELANRVLACRTFEDVSGRLLLELSTYFGASSSCAFEMVRGDDLLVLGRSVQRDMPAGALRDYGAHFLALDPVCAPSFDLRDPRAVGPSCARVVRLSDRCPSRVLLESEYYNDFLRGVRVRHVIGLMARPDGDPSRILVMGFHRPADAPDFDRELDHAAALAPAFQAAAERVFPAQSTVAGMPDIGAWAQRIGLSKREAEVAREVLGGLRNGDVATRMGLSLRTVENHLRSIFAKADVRSRAQLFRSALLPRPSEH
ncbi:MAG TPA: helix-turn-helix transcriptional regulator [Nevskiaceae bacterium]|nr:helix-turn-helix transcriptional regulator [Nevskiaceae bacterium]